MYIKKHLYRYINCFPYFVHSFLYVYYPRTQGVLHPHVAGGWPKGREQSLALQRLRLARKTSGKSIWLVQQIRGENVFFKMRYQEIISWIIMTYIYMYIYIYNHKLYIIMSRKSGWEHPIIGFSWTCLSPRKVMNHFTKQWSNLTQESVGPKPRHDWPWYLPGMCTPINLRLELLQHNPVIISKKTKNNPLFSVFVACFRAL